jgi:hypothetical protein
MLWFGRPRYSSGIVEARLLARSAVPTSEAPLRRWQFIAHELQPVYN